MKPIVEATNLSKLYRLGSTGATSLRETLERRLRKKSAPGPVRAQAGDQPVPPDRAGPEPNTFWALRDLSFSIERGSVVGVLGRNGAGKSTLLKVLSRITEPTHGRVVLRGRVASLLEVGTGFHPELTGKENIMLNGTILGMRRAEILSKFDEIVEFAEVGPFLNTPVKRYSSGMFVRLAFAVAAHLEPEILLVDEVLAVGDAGFQRKCLGKMGEVASQQGRTVFFVSHNMGAVRTLCREAMLIEGGRLVGSGEPSEMISRYLSAGGQSSGEVEGEVIWDGGPETPQADEVIFRSLRLLNERGSPQASFEADRPIAVELSYEVRRRMRGARFRVTLTTQEGEIAFAATDHLFQSEALDPGVYRSVCHIPGGLLNRRNYLVALQCDIPGERYVIPPAEHLSFTVSGAGNQSSHFPETWPGVLCPKIEWTVERLPQNDPLCAEERLLSA